jgi:hypothetical protein
MRNRIFLATLVSLALVGAGAPAADAAVEWAHHVGVFPGESVFGNEVNTYASAGEPYGSGIPCSGLSGWGSECAKTVGEKSLFVLSFYVKAPPYLHDHSEFKTYFNGYFF